MLAFAGWITVDAGITFPGPKFEGIKSLEAHDIAVANGDNSQWWPMSILGNRFATELDPAKLA